MNKEWLQKRISIEEADSRFISDDQSDIFHVMWIELRSKLCEGDELWEFSSSEFMWDHKMGRGGVCIVHDGEVGEGFVTLLS